MSSFGDGNRKTQIEEELNDLFHENYETDNPEDQKQFIFDVMDVLRYLVGNW